MFEQVCILAPGLLGGSLGKAIHRLGLAERVIVWARRPEARQSCADEDWCSGTPTSPEEAAASSDLIVLCPPVDVIYPLAKRIAPHLHDGAIVTDVGSTKSLICRRCDALIPKGRTFVGSHPMAGSEKTGLANSDARLFDRRPCFVTPLPDTDEAATEKVVRFWRELGMEVATMSPESHDEIVAHISHLPHMLATALAAYLDEQERGWRILAGAGLRDTTRIAAGDPNMWKAIVEENREEILRAIAGFENELQELKAAIANHEPFDLLSHLERGKRFRDSL